MDLSYPLYFLIYIRSKFLKKALDKTIIGIKMNAELVNNIRFAADTVLLADSIEKLQYLMERESKESETKI